MNEPLLPCRLCHGKGRLAISPALLRVFNIIQELRRPTCPEIFQKLKRDYRDHTVAPVYVKRLLKLKVIKKVVVNGERVPRYEVA